MKRTFPFSLTAARYEKISAPLKRRPQLLELIRWCNRIITSLFYVIYPIAIGWMLYTRDYFKERAVFIPAAAFIILSVARYWINRPRPYEKLAIQPLVTKKTKGKSFPSRHVFSAFMIAATLSFVYSWGWILFIPAGLMAILRVLLGVHYPSDVVAGALFALISSWFFLL